MSRRPPTLAALLAAVLVLAACGGDGKKPAAARPRPTTTTSAPPTTTTVPGPPTWPLTGIPAPDPNARNHPALVVKIDNAPLSRPHAGINQADVVVSEKVEDGVTRFFAIFHTGGADPVGPVRSARTTDLDLVSALNRPLFAYSGTNPTFQKLVDAAPLVDVGIDRASGDYRRDSSRPRPYNLFSATGKLAAHAPPGAGMPPPLFRYLPPGTTPAGNPASKLHLEYQGRHIITRIDYAWDGATGTWKRSQDGGPHLDTGGVQVAPKNVVVQFVEYRDTGARDTSGAIVPEAGLIGSGDAWVLTGGRALPARWSKPSREAVTTYADATGKEIELTPGQTWVELPPPGMATLG